MEIERQQLRVYIQEIVRKKRGEGLGQMDDLALLHRWKFEELMPQCLWAVYSLMADLLEWWRLMACWCIS